MQKYNVAVNVVLSSLAGKPDTWLVESICQNLEPNDEFTNFLCIHQPVDGRNEYKVTFDLLLTNGDRIPNNWIANAIYDNLDTDDNEDYYNLIITEE